MPTFRDASVTDATAQALLAEYFASRASTFPPSMGSYRTTFPRPADFEPPRGIFLVVEPGIGCGGARRIESEADTVRFEIKHLWVRPTSRGLGIGRALLAELELRARSLGADELVLDTNASLEAAGGLYRSSGFRQIESYNDNPNATHWYGKRGLDTLDQR